MLMTWCLSLCLSLSHAAASAQYARTLQARQEQRDGLFMVLGECEARAEATTPELARLAYESCMEEHGAN